MNGKALVDEMSWAPVYVFYCISLLSLKKKL